MRTFAIWIVGSLWVIIAPAQTCLTGNCLNGYGKCSYSQPFEYTYEGNFVDGKWQGEGTLVIPGNLTYTGTFSAHAATGNGTIAYTNGDRYVGDVMDVKMHGKGIYTYANGKSISGTFKDNFPWSGQGHLALTSTSYYEGSFQEGKFHGEGTLHQENGDVFTGTFSGGDLNGYGTYRSKQGVTYEGNFRNSNFNGYGEAHYLDGVYKGYWVNGKREGSGKWYSLSGELLFDGTWENNEEKEPSKASTYEEDRRILSRCYYGPIEASLMEQKGTMDLVICFQLSSDYSLSGSSTSTISIEGRSYTSRMNITGNYDHSANRLSFYETSVIREDVLPSGLYWTHDGSYSGQIYNNKNHSGYYFIVGRDSKGSRFEITDYH